MTDLNVKLMEEMRAALFGAVRTEVKSPRLSAYAAGYIVDMRVRDTDGKTFDIAVPVRTVSRLEAWTEAHKYAKVSGLRVEWILDVRQTEKRA